MSNALTIHKEIEKKKHEESPLGKLEKEISKIYDQLYLTKKKLTPELAKRVSEIRTDNEKWQLNYIDDRLKIDRDAVDAKLLESMSKELELLQSNGY